MYHFESITDMLILPQSARSHILSARILPCYLLSIISSINKCLYGTKLRVYDSNRFQRRVLFHSSLRMMQLETRATAPVAARADSSSPISTIPTAQATIKTHLVKAGSGSFRFEPARLENVSVGDVVTFEFYPPDHSVARAEFGSPCMPYEYTGKDKKGFWSQTQWVNNTSEVCRQSF